MAKYQVSCPHCDADATIDESMAGRRARCSSCQQVFTLPSATPRPAPAPWVPSNTAEHDDFEEPLGDEQGYELGSDTDEQGDDLSAGPSGFSDLPDSLEQSESPLAPAFATPAKVTPQIPLPNRRALAIIICLLRIWGLVHVSIVVIAMTVGIVAMIFGGISGGAEGFAAAGIFSLLLAPAAGLLLTALLLFAMAEVLDVLTSQERLLTQAVNELRR